MSGLKYLKSYVDRHGRQRHYVRRRGSRETPILAEPGTDEFDRQYRAATMSPMPPPAPRPFTARIPARWSGVTHGVYFVEAAGMIKIGFSSNIKHRMMNLQIGSPVVITLLHVEPGGVEMERELHDRFAAHRRHGEWFVGADEIIDFVKAREQIGDTSVSPSAT